jgi:hypothetical protein
MRPICRWVTGGAAAGRFDQYIVHSSASQLLPEALTPACLRLLQVIPCSRVSTHNWKLCHFSHVGEVAARRRHPSCHQADLCAYVSAVSSSSLILQSTMY